MSIYTPWGILFVFLVALLVIRFPIFSATDHKWHGTTSRSQTLDGLRGYLALGVFVHHAIIYYQYMNEGAWDNPPSILYTQLGPIGVSLFFMVTGYLFWAKVISQNGRPEWLKMFVGRVFRITPVYYFLTALMLFIIFSKTNFDLQEPLEKVFKEVLPLFFFGIFEPGKVINGFNSPRVITAAVTWTLRYEWIFYLIILPFSSLFARTKLIHLCYSLCMLVFLLMGAAFFDFSSNSLLLAAFFVGMLCASLQDVIFEDGLSDRIKSLLVLLLLYIMFFEPVPISNAGRVLLTGVVFYAVVNGCSIYGALLSKSAQRMGEISYGIYLLQGVVLYSFVGISAVKELALSSPYIYWIFVAVEAVTLILMAYFAYCFIEKPGIDMGKRIVKRFSKNVSSVDAALNVKI